MSKTPRVLILEPRKKWQTQWSNELEGIVELIFANSLDEAELLFDGVNYIDIVVVTCSDLRDMKKTIDWIHEIQNGFDGALIPIIGVSDLEGTQQMFRDAGCIIGCERKSASISILDKLRL